ncbi:MAG TPA: Tol-Pal system beta propeller repeat protein TolB [Nitrospirota bacterium]|nr:Tol-Pal system beta propeller repeat protein TolB [Nitrospirota bacterium]
MKFKFFCVFFAAIISLLPAAGICETPEVFLETSKAVSKISIVIPDFTRDGGFADSQKRDVLMADILADDLNFSGFFDAKRVKELKGGASAWTSLGVNNIVQGSYSTDGREIHVGAKLIDPASGAVILSKNYPNALRAMRQTVHRLADEVIFQLTGEKGVCRTKLALVSDMTGHNELYVSDYDGHNVFRMTRDEGTCLLPGWSPSGNYITYTSYKRLNPDLWWVSSSGKSRGILSFHPGLNMAGSWSPDGERIALTLSKDGNSEIYTVGRDGGGLKRLTHNAAIDTSPTWSPNGREVAFNSDRSGSPQIFVMDSHGGNARRLTFMGKYNASPAWSPKGDKIAYVSRENGLFNIYTMDVTGENVVRLTYNQGHNENPSWSPDGRHIVFSSTRRGAKALYIMDTDGSNVRRLGIPGNSQTPAWSPWSAPEK